MASLSGDSVAIFKDGIQSLGAWLRFGGGDSYDRISSRYSVFICAIFVILVSGGQYIGDPIDCWTPAEFTDQWVRYTDQYCWVKNTYYVSLTQDIPEHPVRGSLEISYYQWTPIILCFEALLFLFPSFIWKMLSAGANYDAKEIIKECRNTEGFDTEKRDELMKHIAKNFDRLLTYRRPRRGGIVAKIKSKADQMCCMPGKKYGNYLIYIYFLVKLLYIGVACLHLYGLDEIVGTGDLRFGIHSIYQIINNHGWESSSFFPRITLCDFRVRRLGQNIHTYTMQCVLPYNLFYEKIYIFIWWWLAFVIAMSIIGFVKWIPYIFPTSDMSFVGKCLESMDRFNGKSDDERKKLCDFTRNYLRRDGIFTLRFVADGVDELRSAELVCVLYELFRSKDEDGNLSSIEEDRFKA